MTDGTLYKHVKPDYRKLVGPSDNWRVVVARGDRRGIIKVARDPPLAAHSGVFMTLSRVAAKYYWPKMTADITRYVKNCKIYTAYKPNQQPVVGCTCFDITDPVRNYGLLGEIYAANSTPLSLNRKSP